MAITAEELERYEIQGTLNRAHQTARVNEERFIAGKFTIGLVKAPDDAGEGEMDFQDELSRFGARLRSASCLVPAFDGAGLI
jgi:hypothetical protein